MIIMCIIFPPNFKRNERTDLALNISLFKAEGQVFGSHQHTLLYLLTVRFCLLCVVFSGGFLFTSFSL